MANYNSERMESFRAESLKMYEYLSGNNMNGLEGVLLECDNFSYIEAMQASVQKNPVNTIIELIEETVNK